MSPYPISSFKWNDDQITSSIFTMAFLGYEVYVVLLGSSLLCCYTNTSEQTLTCVQYEKADEDQWNMGTARRLVSRFDAEYGYVTDRVEASKLLGRLPGIGGSVADIILSLMGASPSEAFVAWEVKKKERTIKTPRSISYGDIGCLRDGLKAFLIKNDIKRSEFAKLAKVSTSTLSNFIDNKRDTQVEKVDRIRTALESLQNKT